MSPVNPLSFLLAASVFGVIGLACGWLAGRWLFGWRESVLWVGTTGDRLSSPLSCGGVGCGVLVGTTGGAAAGGECGECE